MMDNLKHIVFFLEYLVLPLLAIYFALYVKTKAKPKQSLLSEILEDLDIDFKIISCLGICLFGLSLIGHNEGDYPALYIYGTAGLVICAIFLIILLLKVIDTNRNSHPVISSTFFGLSQEAIYRQACLQIYSLFFYVAVGLVLKKINHLHQMEEYLFFFLTLIFLAVLFVYFTYNLLNRLIVKFLKTQGVFTFNNLYKQENRHYSNMGASVINETDYQIKQVSHLLANAQKNDPSTVGLLQYLSELYEVRGEFYNAESCIRRIIAIYEDKKINKEVNNIIDAYIYKIDLQKRFRIDEKLIAKSIFDLVRRFPNDARVKELMKENDASK